MTKSHYKMFEYGFFLMTFISIIQCKIFLLKHIQYKAIPSISCEYTLPRELEDIKANITKQKN